MPLSSSRNPSRVPGMTAISEKSSINAWLPPSQDTCWVKFISRPASELLEPCDCCSLPKRPSTNPASVQRMAVGLHDRIRVLGVHWCLQQWPPILPDSSPSGPALQDRVLPCVSACLSLLARPPALSLQILLPFHTFSACESCLT